MVRWPSTLDASQIFFASKLQLKPYSRSSFATELISQLRKYGFARVRNHGVAPATVKGLFEYHRRFFDLPLSAKLSVRHPGGEAPARGYSPWAYEKTAVLRPDLHTAPTLESDSTTTTKESDLPFFATRSQHANVQAESTIQSPTPLLDAREQFAIGPPKDTAFPTPQLDEKLLPGFDEATRKAYKEIGETCRVLVDVIEEGLSAPTGSISTRTSGGEGAELNLNFYPEVEKSVLEGSVGARVSENNQSPTKKASMRRIWPHSDLGVVSALLQHGIGASGLELETRESRGNEFAPLSIEKEGDMVLLVSDTLERWTNGYLRAAVHRVGSPPAITPSIVAPESGNTHIPERRSAVMFYRAPPHIPLGPLSHFVSADRPSGYDNVTAEEYLKRHNKRLY
ncbi:unnamed protein product [Periconia digitata]|uniref:Fe2OG dioxygenase domain-containing protein n=1 Tax=Periconia digitata TaxID=1303443 RepID=A0A9W4UWM7_9PLEO|nr:unnamed protein product [Periconia digitata]